MSLWPSSLTCRLYPLFLLILLLLLLLLLIFIFLSPPFVSLPYLHSIPLPLHFPPAQTLVNTSPPPLPPPNKEGEKWPPGRTWNSTDISAPTPPSSPKPPIFDPFKLAHLIQLVVDDEGAASDAEEADEEAGEEDDAHELATGVGTAPTLK